MPISIRIAWLAPGQEGSEAGVGLTMALMQAMSAIGYKAEAQGLTCSLDMPQSQLKPVQGSGPSVSCASQPPPGQWRD